MLATYPLVHSVIVAYHEGHKELEENFFCLLYSLSELSGLRG